MNRLLCKYLLANKDYFSLKLSLILHFIGPESISYLSVLWDPHSVQSQYLIGIEVELSFNTGSGSIEILFLFILFLFFFFGFFFFAGGRSRVTSKESFIYCGYTCDNKHYKSLVITSPSSRDDMSFRSRWGRGRAMHNSSSPDQGVV